MCDTQSEGNPFGHTTELDHEPQRAGAHEIPTDDDRIANAAASPSKQQPPEQSEADGFVQLRWMYRDCGWRKSVRKCDSPRQIRWYAVIVAAKKTPETAD